MPKLYHKVLSSTILFESYYNERSTKYCPQSYITAVTLIALLVHETE